MRGSLCVFQFSFSLSIRENLEGKRMLGMMVGKLKRSVPKYFGNEFLVVILVERNMLLVGNTRCQNAKMLRDAAIDALHGLPRRIAITSPPPPCLEI